jgi:MoaA/NifB/PqqE/SkfB family radical SAM enzyme
VIPFKTSYGFVRSWFLPCDKPFKLSLSLTDRCNSRCLHCGIWKGGSKNDLPLQAIGEIFRQYPHFTWIDISGGEIFLRQDLLEVVGAIVQNTRRLEYLHFPTNALCENTLAQILKIRRMFGGKLVITVSIDGPAVMNDRVRGVPGSFMKAVRLLKDLSGAKLPDTSVYAGMTLFAENAASVPETFRALTEAVPGFREKRLHVNFAHAASYYHNRESLRPFPGGYRDIAFLARQSGISPFALIEKSFRKLYQAYRNSGKCPLPCRSGEVSLFIDNAAVLRPCTMWDMEGVPLAAHGYGIRKALSTPEFTRLVSIIRKAGCTHCFTACEAYQTMLSSPLRTLSRLIRSNPEPRA